MKEGRLWPSVSPGADTGYSSIPVLSVYFSETRRSPSMALLFLRLCPHPQKLGFILQSRPQSRIPGKERGRQQSAHLEISQCRSAWPGSNLFQVANVSQASLKDFQPVWAITFDRTNILYYRFFPHWIPHQIAYSIFVLFLKIVGTVIPLGIVIWFRNAYSFKTAVLINHDFYRTSYILGFCNIFIVLVFWL